MKKSLFLSLLFFALGVGAAYVVTLNPLHNSWIDTLRHRLGIPHAASSGEQTPAEGQLWTCSMHPQVLQDKPGYCPICQMALTPVRNSAGGAKVSREERKIKYWRAPMDPSFIADKPGKSPMGMDLVPVYEDEVEGLPGVIRIDPQFVQSIGVKSVPVTKSDIGRSIRTVGYLTYNDQQIYQITPKYEGWIEKAYINYVGQSVDKGQPVFEIYSPQLVTTQKEYLQAIEYVERMSVGNHPEIEARAKSLLAATRERLSYWDISEAQIHDLEKSHEVRRTLTLHSEVSGVVASKMDQAFEGMYVKPGMGLMKVVDLSTIWVEAEVFEDQVSWVKTGQLAQVELSNQPGRILRGRVRYAFPYYNEKTRSLKLSIELPNPGRELRAGMYADVSFDVPSARGVPAVPEDAVIHSGLRELVVIDLGDGTFQVKEVETGASGAGLVEIRRGVREGQRVVVSSQFLIDSESNLREAVRQLTGGASIESLDAPPPGEGEQRR